MAITVGEQAPSFTLLDKDRQQVTIESFAGKRLVLAFYPMAFTGG